MPEALIALGANLGEPVEALRSAVKAIEEANGIRLLGVSRFYTTSPSTLLGLTMSMPSCESRQRLTRWRFCMFVRQLKMRTAACGPRALSMRRERLIWMCLPMRALFPAIRF